MSFPRDYDDIYRLDEGEAKDAVFKIVQGIWSFADLNPHATLENLVAMLDSCQDDEWGTEGWRHSILGED